MADQAPSDITQARVNHVINWSVDRLHAVAKALLESVLGSGFENFAARQVVDGLLSTWGKAKLREFFQKNLEGVTAG